MPDQERNEARKMLRQFGDHLGQSRKWFPPKLPSQIYCSVSWSIILRRILRLCLNEDEDGAMADWRCLLWM